ncbi:MAG: glutamate-cysteine ligase family protein [Candidatus Heimdallarchaeota archaeon]
MSNKSPTNRNPANSAKSALRKLPFTHGLEVENFITNKRGEILEDGKELVAVWDQMFNGALGFLKSLTSSNRNVPDYIRKKIKRVSRKDVERHGKMIRYVQIEYAVNGKSIAINVFGPDPNISQITWLLELVTPPCEFVEEMDWWINTLYLAASQSITKGYNIQALGFNPYQSEYRAGVTCGEHHHLGGFKNKAEKSAAYNMIRAYIPHLIALSNTSPFVNGQPAGRIILKKGADGRTLILAPDSVRSFRLKENSGQLGPNMPDYLPHVGPSYTKTQFSRHVRKEIPDDRYVDAYPYTAYGTIECRFFDAQYDQSIRIAIILLLQALALKGAKMVRAGTPIPEIKGNTLYEHRKRAVNFGMFAKFQGDPSIEASGGIFAKYYNHNPETGGPPGKIYESLRALLIWLKPELTELRIKGSELSPLLIMLWGTARIAPPISAATFMFYLYEQNHNNVASLIKSLGLMNGRPKKIFSEILGQPDKSITEFVETKAAKPVRTADTSRSALARKLQTDSRSRRKRVMAKERERLKVKQAQAAKMQREKIKRDKVIEKKRLERLKLIERAKKPPPKPIAGRTSRPLTAQPVRRPSSSSRSKPVATIRPTKPTKKLPARTRSTTTKSRRHFVKKKSPQKKYSSAKSKSLTRRKTPIKAKTSSRKPTKKSTKKAKPKSLQKFSRGKVQAYASTASSSRYRTQNAVLPKPRITKSAKSNISRTKQTSKTSNHTIKGSTKSVTATPTFQQEEFFKESKFVRSVSVHNFPSKIDYSLFVPTIKIKWRRSILQSKISHPVKIEAEFVPLTKGTGARRRTFQETFNLEKTSLMDFCYLPIPIQLNNYVGEFQIRFIVRDGKSRKILATAHKLCVKAKVPRNKTHTITSLSTSPNPVGEAFVKVKVNISKTNTRGKLTLWGLSQRGIIKLYEKKSRFSRKSFTIDMPVVIPLSMCSSKWHLLCIFNGRGSSTSTSIKVSPPLSKLINFSLLGNPPLKSRIRSNYITEITPKLQFKAQSDIREIHILQFTKKAKSKLIKRYRLKTRVKKGENFVLESFEWKAPSMRKGLFRSYKQRTVSFYCRIVDTVGIINDTHIGVVQTPTITVVK